MLSLKVKNRHFLILYLAIALALFGLCKFLFDYNGLYGQDSYEYARYSNDILNYWSGGTMPSNFSWPKLFPLLGALVSFMLNYPVEIGLQIVSILSLVVASYVIGFLLSERAGVISGHLWAMSSVLLAPFLFRLGLSSMSDPLSVFFIALGILGIAKYKEQHNLSWFLAAIVGITGAFVSRWAAFPIAFCLSIILAMEWRYFKVQYLLIAAGIALVFFMPEIIFQDPKGQGVINAGFFSGWTPLNLFKSSFITNDGITQYTTINIVKAFEPFYHPGLAFPFLLCILSVRIIFKDAMRVKLFLLVLAYLVFIGCFPLQNSRFFVVIIPILSYLFYPAFLTTTKVISKKLSFLKPAHVLILLLSIQVSMSSYALTTYLQFNQDEKELSQAFKDMRSERVYCYGTSMLLKHYNKNNEFISLYKIAKNPYQVGDYYLHNTYWEDEEKLSKMFFLKFFKEHSDDFRMEAKYKKGWALYRYQP